MPSLEVPDRSLRDLDHSFGVRGIAKIGATTQRAATTRGASSPDLIGTFAAVLGRHRRHSEKEVGFRRGQEQRVTVFGESTASAADVTTRVLGGNLRVQVGVKRKQLGSLGVASHQMRIIDFFSLISSIV